MERDYFDEAFDTHRKSLQQTILNQDWLSAWQKDVAELQEAKNRYHTKLQVILAETKPEYVPQKKAALQTELAQVVAAQKAELLKTYDWHINELDVRAKKKAGPQDLKPGWETLQANRLIDKIEAMDPVTVRGEYESKLQDPTGDHGVWLTAAEYAQTPMGQPMLPGEILDLGARSRARRTMDPSDRQKITDLQELRDAHQHFINLVARELPVPDAIAEMAGVEPPDAA